jgi:predicted RecA/RadA family phage recombinase
MAKNLIYAGAAGLPVVCSDPATPASGDPVRFGEMTGVALNAEETDGKTVVDFEPGKVWDLSVKAVNGSGNSAVAVGDKLYYVDADTPKLSKKDTGRFFGFALEAITSGSTDTINVMKALA